MTLPKGYVTPKFANYDKKRVEFLNLLSRYKMDMSKKNFDSIIALI